MQIKETCKKKGISEIFSYISKNFSQEYNTTLRNDIIITLKNGEKYFFEANNYINLDELYLKCPNVKEIELTEFFYKNKLWDSETYFIDSHPKLSKCDNSKNIKNLENNKTLIQQILYADHVPSSALPRYEKVSEIPSIMIDARGNSSIVHEGSEFFLLMLDAKFINLDLALINILRSRVKNCHTKILRGTLKYCYENSLISLNKFMLTDMQILVGPGYIDIFLDAFSSIIYPFIPEKKEKNGFIGTFAGNNVYVSPFLRPNEIFFLPTSVNLGVVAFQTDLIGIAIVSPIVKQAFIEAEQIAI